MAYNAPTYRLPTYVREERRPSPNLVARNQLRVWAFCRWRGARDVAEFFLSSGYRHLPSTAPTMYKLDEFYDGNGGLIVGYYVTFTNSFDADELIGKAYWYGCEFIAFTTFNIFTNFTDIFCYHGTIHGLLYEDDKDDE